MKNNLFNLSSIEKYAKNFELTPEKKLKLEEYIERVNKGEFKGETKGYPALLKFLEDILDYEEAKHIIFDDNVAIGKDRVEFALKDENGKFMIIELKSQEYEDLEKPQNRANDKRSPIDQAFGYAQKSSIDSGLVDWILISNYKEFRLYNYEKRQGEYISFNVNDLLKNEKEFKYFMFAFSKKSHIDLKAINDIVDEEYIEKSELANNFYKLFNETRLMIYKELKELHGMSKEDAISNAQTILDRFIFICFASSRYLLPDNIAHNTLLDRIKSEKLRDHEIWRELNHLFIDVNKGSDDGTISEYNGGLFKYDLKDIKLKDVINDKDFFKTVYQKWNFKEFEERIKKEVKPSILKRLNPIYVNLLIISYFDFSKENEESNGHRLDIDILGHIFENSIGDIEEIKADTKGRRKKDGIFYTPDYITDYICRNTIIPYLSTSGKANTVPDLIKEYTWGKDIEKLDEKVKNIKIVDPACGSGAFLNKAADILLEIHEEIFNTKKSYTTSTSMRVGKGKRRRTEEIQHVDLGVYVFDALSKRREILLNNIYGVDLNSESVEITKLSLFLKVCEKDKKLPDIDKNIRCGNSLIDDPEFTDKSFKWEEKFKEIFKADGFNIVIGNPPYVRADLGDENYQKQRKWLKESGQYSTLYERWDLFIPFIEKGLKILKKDGILSFIISNSYNTSKFADKSKKFIFKNHHFKKIDFFEDITVFKGVGVESVIITIEKSKKDTKTQRILHIKSFKNFKELEPSQDIKNMFKINKGLDLSLNFKNTDLLGDICYINYGMSLNAHEKKFKGEFGKDDLISDYPTKINIKPYIEAKNIERYKINKIRYLEWDTERCPAKIRRPTFPELYIFPKLIRGITTEAIFDDKNLLCNHSVSVFVLYNSLKDMKNQSIENSIKK